LDKALTKTVLRAAGIPTPDFAVIGELPELEAVKLPFPVFAKPIAEGTGKGVTPASRISDRGSLRSVCDELLARFRQPVLVERFLPGRELTVGVIGTGAESRVLGTIEILLRDNAEAGVYSYVNKEESEERVSYRLIRPAEDPLVREAESISLRAWRSLGCRDGGRIDIRCDEHGRPHFLEVNPLAGLHPHHSDLPIIGSLLGISYLELIDQLVRSAARRVRPRVLSCTH
jgi:D-alanine-D-alanine ligase